MNAITALLLLLLGALLPAAALSRSRVLALPLVAPVAIVACGCGALLSALLSVPLVAVVFPLFSALNVWAVWDVLRRQALQATARRLFSRAKSERLERGGEASFAALLLSLVMLCFRAAPPGSWDARSIWWFHASWFYRGGEVVREATKNRLLKFSHPEYPPGDPSVIATIWRVVGREDLYLGQAVTAVLTGLALASLVGVLSNRWPSHGLVVAVMCLMVAACVSLGSGLAANGYVDVLMASLLAAAFVVFLDSARPRSSVIGGLLLCAACLTKGEALVFGLVGCIALLVVIERARRRRAAYAMLVALLPAVSWLGFVRSINPSAEGDVQPRGFIRLLSLSSRETERFRVALPRVAGAMAVFAVGAVVVTVVATAFRRRRTSALPLSLVAIGMVVSALVVCVYAAGTLDTKWWLATSLDRVTTLPKTIFLAAVAVGLLDVWLPDTGRRMKRRGAQPSRGTSAVPRRVVIDRTTRARRTLASTALMADEHASDTGESQHAGSDTDTLNGS
jgi:hypothetical protein